MGSGRLGASLGKCHSPAKMVQNSKMVQNGKMVPDLPIARMPRSHHTFFHTALVCHTWTHYAGLGLAMGRALGWKSKLATFGSNGGDDQTLVAFSKELGVQSGPKRGIISLSRVLLICASACIPEFIRPKVGRECAISIVYLLQCSSCTISNGWIWPTSEES